jgi:hypothetical protein
MLRESIDDARRESRFIDVKEEIASIRAAHAHLREQAGGRRFAPT